MKKITSTIMSVVGVGALCTLATAIAAEVADSLAHNSNDYIRDNKLASISKYAHILDTNNIKRMIDALLSEGEYKLDDKIKVLLKPRSDDTPKLDGVLVNYNIAEDSYNITIRGNVLDSLNIDELRFMLAHELAHIDLGHLDYLRDHTLYYTAYTHGYYIKRSNLIKSPYWAESEADKEAITMLRCIKDSTITISMLEHVFDYMYVTAPNKAIEDQLRYRKNSLIDYITE